MLRFQVYFYSSGGMYWFIYKLVNCLDVWQEFTARSVSLFMARWLKMNTLWEVRSSCCDMKIVWLLHKNIFDILEHYYYNISTYFILLNLSWAVPDCFCATGNKRIDPSWLALWRQLRQALHVLSLNCVYIHCDSQRQFESVILRHFVLPWMNYFDEQTYNCYQYSLLLYFGLKMLNYLIENITFRSCK